MQATELHAEIAVVYTRNGGGRSRPRGAALREPRILVIEGRKFLSGVAITPEGHWLSGHRCHIAWDEVEMIFEFTEDEYRTHGRTWSRRQGGAWFRWFRPR
jgi:hypothetical protein